MTTICYRDGVMAADSRGFGGDKVPIGAKLKIRRLPDGTLIGATSTKPGATEWLLDWYAKGHPFDEPHPPESFCFLAVSPNGNSYFACDALRLSGPLEAPFFAIGSGEAYALGAMAHGASALAAIAVAIELDVWSDGPVYTATHSADPVVTSR